MVLPSHCRSWLIGVSIAVIANIISNLGLNFQKKAHSIRQSSSETATKDEDIEVTEHLISSNNLSSIPLQPINGEHKQENNNKKCKPPNKMNKSKSEIDDEDISEPYVCDIIWLLGLFLQILGGILDFVALGYAPQSVVAPLGSLTLVVNVFLSPCMHQQKPSFKILLFTTIIIIGAAITVASSPRNDNIAGITAVFNLYTNISFFIYAIFTVMFIIIGWIIIQQLINHRLYDVYYYKYHRFFIAAISGTMGAQNILFAKSISTLIVTSIENKNDSHNSGMIILFTYWQTYLLLFGLIITIYFQLKWLNDGLQIFSPLYVAPTFQAFWITVSVFGGLVVFNEFDVMNYYQKIIFAMGVIITILGVFCLTQQDKPQQLQKGTITIRHYIPLLLCFLVLYLMCSAFLHSKYSLCQ